MDRTLVSWLRRCALVAGLALFVACSVEVGVRARILFNDPHRWDSDGLFRYRADAQVGDIPDLTTNRDGFFGPDLVTPKPTDTLRVILLGSSPLTNPVLPAALGAHIEERLPGLRCEVNSAGIPRYTSWHVALLFERYVVPLDPDWVVVYLGLNDNVYNTNPGLTGQPPAGLWNWADRSGSVVVSIFRYHAYAKRFGVTRDFDQTPSRQELARNLRNLLDTARTAGIRVLLVQMAVADAADDPALEAVVGAAEGPMSHFWGTRAASMRGLAAHNAVLEQLATEYDVPLVNADPAIPDTAMYFRDFCHLTPEGNRRLAAFLAESLANHN